MDKGKERFAHKGLGIAALTIAVFGMGIPGITIYLVWLALILAALSAFLGNKVFPLAATSRVPDQRVLPRSAHLDTLHGRTQAGPQSDHHRPFHRADRRPDHRKTEEARNQDIISFRCQENAPSIWIQRQA